MAEIKFLNHEEVGVLDFESTLKFYSIGIKPLNNSNFVYICSSDKKGKLIHVDDFAKLHSDQQATILHTFDEGIIESLKNIFNLIENENQ